METEVPRRFTGHKHTDATKLKISMALRGQVRRLDTRAKHAASTQLKRARLPADVPDAEWDDLFARKLEELAVRDYVNRAVRKQLHAL